MFVVRVTANYNEVSRKNNNMDKHITFNYLPPTLNNDTQHKNTSLNMSCSIAVACISYSKNVYLKIIIKEFLKIHVTQSNNTKVIKLLIKVSRDHIPSQYGPCNGTYKGDTCS